MNHEDGGFDCPGCAWPDDPSGRRLDICENGVKHVTEFFAAHTVEELAGWNDHDLEAVGRLAEPMSYDPASDTYLPISWDDAFAQVGEIPANYSQGSGTIISGTAASKATEAALAAYPGGGIDRVVKLSNGEYEVHDIGVNWPHHIFVSQSFKVVGAD
jgi:anaerobic selenocysteine-containing dehydrogenase